MAKKSNTVNFMQVYAKKRDLKGFKCMTVSLDVFEDFSRLFEMFGIVQIYLEYF